MLTINFSPQFNVNGQQVMSWNSPVLTIDNEDYDLSLIPDGGSAQTEGVLRYAERNGDDYEVLILLNNSFNNCPYETRFPEQQVITEDGSIDVPLYEEIE